MVFVEPTGKTNKNADEGWKPQELEFGLYGIP